MADRIDGNSTQPDGSSNRINQPFDKSSPGKGKQPTTRTRTPTGTPGGNGKQPASEGKQTENTQSQVILDEVKANREGVDIQLKSANVESLPDENVLIGAAAAMLLMLLDGIGMMTFGDYGKLNATERMMIDEPLKRMLQKTSPAQLAAIGKYADPVMLSMGLLAWISRVTSEAKRRKETTTNPPPAGKQPEVVNPVTPEAANEIPTNPPPEIVNNFAPAEVTL